MKRALLLGLLLLGLGALAGLWLLRDPGYVLLSWHLVSVEMSLWVALAAWLLSLLGALLVFDLVWRLLGLSTWWQRWSQSRNSERSARAFQEGTVALELGDWKRAERLLFSAARLSSEPLPAYLAAARAAAHAQAFDRAEQYLVLAEEQGNRLAVGLARTRLLLAAGRWEQAAALLLRLQDKFPRDDSVLMLRIEALLRLQKWGELSELLPTLQKLPEEDDGRYAALEQRAHSEVLAWVGLAGGRVDRNYAARKLRKYWSELPKRLRSDDELLAAYGRELLIAGADDDAEALLAEALERQWSHALVEVYGRTRSTRPDSALARAEAWKEKHPHNPALMLALGRLCLQNRRWSEARQYLESALELRKSPETYAELIRLLTHLDDREARHYLVESLGPQNARLPDLPLP